MKLTNITPEVIGVGFLILLIGFVSTLAILDIVYLFIFYKIVELLTALGGI